MQQKKSLRLMIDGCWRDYLPPGHHPDAYQFYALGFYKGLPSGHADCLSFRLTKPTKPSSNTGEDEQPDPTNAQGVRV